MRLADPLLLLLGLLFLPVIATTVRPHLGYSSLSLFGEASRPPLGLRLPGWLMGLGVCLLLVALARPQWGYVVEEERRQSRDLILIVDLSGSMDETLRTGGGTKLDLAKTAAARFLEGRRGDRVGLLVFGEDTYGSWPLSDDLEVVREKIRALRANLGGTDLIKPLQGALVHFRQFGQSRSKAIVLITDGEARVPEPQRQEIQARLTAMDVHLYVLGIELSKSADIVDLVSRSAGRVWQIDDAGEFSSRFQEIDRLEPSMVVIDKRLTHRDLYPWLASGGLAFVSLAIVIGATLAPRVP